MVSRRADGVITAIVTMGVVQYVLMSISTSSSSISCFPFSFKPSFSSKKKCAKSKDGTLISAASRPWLPYGHVHGGIRTDSNVDFMKTLLQEVDSAMYWDDENQTLFSASWSY